MEHLKRKSNKIWNEEEEKETTNKKAKCLNFTKKKKKSQWSLKFKKIVGHSGQSVQCRFIET